MLKQMENKMKLPPHPPFKPLPWVAVLCKWNHSVFQVAQYGRWKIWIPVMTWLLRGHTVWASPTVPMASVCFLVKLSVLPCQVDPVCNLPGKSALTKWRPVRSSSAVIKHQLDYCLLQGSAKHSCQGPDTELFLATWWLLSSAVWHQSHKWKGHFQSILFLFIFIFFPQ